MSAPTRASIDADALTKATDTVRAMVEAHHTPSEIAAACISQFLSVVDSGRRSIAATVFGLQLPVSQSGTDFGVMVDATGREIFTIDVNRDRPDPEVAALGAWLAMTINRPDCNHG